jgi:hypothetical protein
MVDLRLARVSQHVAAHDPVSAVPPAQLQHLGGHAGAALPRPHLVDPYVDSVRAPADEGDAPAAPGGAAAAGVDPVLAAEDHAQFLEHGFVVLRRAIPRPSVDAALAAIAGGAAAPVVDAARLAMGRRVIPTPRSIVYMDNH